MPRPSNPFTLLWGHRDLVVQFTVRELHLRHRGSQLGHFWALLSPLTMLALYLFVFGMIMGGKFGVIQNETTFDFALAMFLGLSLFHIIAETISAAPLLIVSQPNFVKKVVFPLEIIPISHVFASVYHATLSIGILVVIAPFSHTGIAWQGLIALPFLILPLALMALGLSWGLSALGVFVRDISQLGPFLSTAILFSSAVVYAPAKIPPEIWAILRFNPLLQAIAEARKVLLWHQALDFGALGYAYACAALSLLIGYTLFARLRPFFAEVI